MSKATGESNTENPTTKPAHPPVEHRWAKDEKEEDRVEKLIRDSGCWDQHLATVECMGEKEDWRKCQKELADFRECMNKNRKVPKK